MKVPIQNVYYLLCFAWEMVPEQLAYNVGSLPASSDVLDLCAYLLSAGTARLLREGLDRGYVQTIEETTKIRGRVQMAATFLQRGHGRREVICEFDELSVNTLQNQILRASVRSLIDAERVDQGLKQKLRDLDGHMEGIDVVRITDSLFGRVQIHRNNRVYTFLLFICHLIFTLRMPDHGIHGSGKFNDLLSDEKTMERVFEHFLRNFYRLKQKQFHSVSSTVLKWNASAVNPGQLNLLPIMKTDLTLRSESRVIILDAKYYKDALQEHYGTPKIDSANLYQLCAYLRAASTALDGVKPEGILVYPVGGQTLDASFVIDGYSVRLYTVNLNQEWRLIERDLLQLVQIA